MKDPRPLRFLSATPGAPARRVGALALAAILLTGVGRAQLPNDTCGGAIPMNGGFNGPFSNVGATVFNSLPMACALTNSAVWFSYTSFGYQTVTFSTCGTGGTLDDTVLQVLSASSGTNPCLVPVPIDCNDDDCGTSRSSVAVTASAFDEFFVRVAGKGLFSNQGTFGIQVTLSNPPAPNDACSTAIAVVNGFNGPFWNDGAGVLNTFPMACALSNSVVWFKYTANGDGPRTFSTCGTGGSLGNTVLQVLHNGFFGCLAPVPLGCNNDSCGGERSSVTVSLSDGEEYFVRVAGSGLLANQGTFGLLVTVAPPANNECVGATEVFAPGGIVDFNNVAATTSGSQAAFCGIPYNSDVWFKWVATCDGMTTFSTCAPPSSTPGWPPELPDTVLQVLSGTCGSLLGLGQNCNDDACGANGFKSSVSVPVTSGTTYFIRVGDYGPVATYGEFRLSIDCCPGSFTSIPTGCGAAPPLLASGSPCGGNAVSYGFGGAVTLPLIWIGLPTSVPLCPPASCSIGASLGVVLPAGAFSATIPNDPALSGLTLAVQAAALISSGGCGPPTYGVVFTVSNTIVTTIG